MTSESYQAYSIHPKAKFEQAAEDAIAMYEYRYGCKPNSALCKVLPYPNKPILGVTLTVSNKVPKGVLWLGPVSGPDTRKEAT